jgi:hypothetical protein
MVTQHISIQLQKMMITDDGGDSGGGGNDKFNTCSWF